MKIDTNVLPLWSHVLYHLAESYPDRLSDFANSFSQTQKTSKEWLFNVIRQKQVTAKHVLIIGGWYGTYTLPLMFENLNPSKIVFSEYDSVCCDVVGAAFRDRGVEVQWRDMADSFDRYSITPFDLIINTSCEHMVDMKYLHNVNPDCVYAFQSSDNRDDPGHINTSSSSAELIEKTGISDIMYAGSLVLSSTKKRFMVVGKKR